MLPAALPAKRIRGGFRLPAMTATGHRPTARHLAFTANWYFTLLSPRVFER
jgi:hypothetical protein